jgi:hypothetical protein
MDKTDEFMVQHFENLVIEGSEIIQLISELDIIDPRFPKMLNGKDVARVNTWVTRCGQFIKNICSEDSVYYKRLESVFNSRRLREIDKYSEKDIGIVLGSVQAFYNDYKDGLLVNVRNLLRAEIFSDFLEMGEHLLNEGYKDAAAVIIGSVLEDTLRNLAVQNDISIKKNNGDFKTIGPLNLDLYNEKVYDKLIMKQIDSLGDIRNKAAHGHYNEYDEEQVRIMLLSIERFCSDYIS